MRRLNILIICDSVIHQAGGAFISPLRFAELLKKRGHKVIFIAAKYPNTPSVDNYNGIRVYRFRSFALPKFEKLIRLTFPTEEEIEGIIKKEKIDIVHIMIPAPASFFSIKSARENNIKVVSHSHTQPENIIIHFPPYMRSKLLINLIYKYLVWLYNKTDITICPSKFAEKSLKRYDSSLKTTVISNGVNISEFKKIKHDSFSKKYKLSKNNKYLLYLGRLHPEKSIETLIRAMPLIIKECSFARLNIAGRGYQREELERLVKDLKINKYVKFLGRIPDKELVMAYNSCDIFVLPSLAELEGMVVLEAMACGKPILIANSKDSASTYFVDGNGFLFKPKDPADLAKKAISLLKNENLIEKMSKGSLEIIKDYDINKSVSKIEKVYMGLLK